MFSSTSSSKRSLIHESSICNHNISTVSALHIDIPCWNLRLTCRTIINSFGHSPTISQLLTVPPYIFAGKQSISMSVLTSLTSVSPASPHLCPRLGQNQDALPFHFPRACSGFNRIFDQYLECSKQRQIFWDIPLHWRRIRGIPWRYRLVNIFLSVVCLSI